MLVTPGLTNVSDPVRLLKYNVKVTTEAFEICSECGTGSHSQLGNIQQCNLG